MAGRGRPKNKPEEGAKAPQVKKEEKKVYKVIQKFNYNHTNYDVGETISGWDKDIIEELIRQKAII